MLEYTTAWQTASLACFYSEVFRNVCLGFLCVVLIVFVWNYLRRGK